MFKFILKKLKSAQIELEKLTIEVPVESKEELFAAALERTVLEDLASQIEDKLIRICYGDVIVDNTLAYMRCKDAEARKLIKPIFTDRGKGLMPRDFSLLARKIAEIALKELK